jgi:hypothetical protein
MAMSTNPRAIYKICAHAFHFLSTRTEMIPVQENNGTNTVLCLQKSKAETILVKYFTLPNSLVAQA